MVAAVGKGTQLHFGANKCNKKTSVNSFKVCNNVFNASQTIDPNQPSISTAISKSMTVTCLYTNADQLQNKMEELCVYVNEYNPTLILVTEVLPKNNKTMKLSCDSVIYTIDGYSIFAGGNEGRGVNIYVKNEVSETPIKFLNEQYCDASWCTLLDGPSVITLGCIYRSPSAPKDTSILINSLITQASKLDGRLLVIGDFNYPGINWSDWTTQHGEMHEEFLFIESLRDNFLIQHISESTRYREGNEPSTIDLLISNEESDINSITILPGIGLSDHCLLLFEYFCYQKKSHSDESQTFMKYDSCDYIGFCKQWSNIDWETEFVDSNIEDMWNIFKCKYESSVEQFVPKKVIKAGKRKKPLWMI